MGCQTEIRTCWIEGSVDEQMRSPIEKVRAIFQQIEEALARIVDKEPVSVPVLDGDGGAESVGAGDL